ncbi:hypothetical protein, partial [Desulfovibrio sp.]|uniref:hypothetical protein n=1 Tax=Desulfovibrio sp. TaxID=885 RepID=UPI003077DBE7
VSFGKNWYSKVYAGHSLSVPERDCSNVQNEEHIAYLFFLFCVDVLWKRVIVSSVLPLFLYILP